MKRVASLLAGAALDGFAGLLLWIAGVLETEAAWLSIKAVRLDPDATWTEKQQVEVSIRRELLGEG